MNTIRITIASLALVLAAAPGLAQEPRPAQPPGTPPGAPDARPTPTPGPAPVAAPDYVDQKGFKSVVFEIKHRDPGTLAGAVRPLGSGFKGATVAPSREFRTIAVRDFPENIATIEAAIARLDTPEPPRSSVDLHVHVLLASAGPASTPQELPAEIRPAVAQLQATLTYKNVRLLASLIQRATEGPDAVSNWGSLPEPNSPPGDTQGRGYFYRYQMGGVQRSVDAAGKATFVLEKFDFQMEGRPDVRIISDLSLREGEQVVVGTASFNNRAVVLVMSASAVR